MNTVTIQRMERGYLVVATEGSDYYAKNTQERRYAVTTLEEAIEVVRSSLAKPEPAYTEGDPITQGDIYRAVADRPPEVEVP